MFKKFNKYKIFMGIDENLRNLISHSHTFIKSDPSKSQTKYYFMPQITNLTFVGFFFFVDSLNEFL